MNRHRILKALKALSYNEEFYGQILINLNRLETEDKEKYEEIMSELERQNFKSELDIVVYFKKK